MNKLEEKIRGYQKMTLKERFKAVTSDLLECRKSVSFSKIDVKLYVLRVVAFTIDFVLAMSFFILATFVASIFRTEVVSLVSILCALILMLGYLLFKDGYNGQSYGKKMMGIRVFDSVSKHPIDLYQSSQRFVMLTLLIVIEPFVMLATGSKRRIGDFIANTYVERV